MKKNLLLFCIHFFFVLHANQVLAHARFNIPTDPGGAGDVLPRTNDDDFKDENFLCGVAPTLPGGSRSTNPNLIKTFPPGATITIRFRETINHTAHYRVVFSMDGNTPNLTANPEYLLYSSTTDGNNYNGLTQITLPNIECNNCTLGFAQIMDPNGVPTEYRSCADIVLQAGAPPPPPPSEPPCPVVN